MQLSELLRREVSRHFPNQESCVTAVAVLEGTTLQFLDVPERDRDRQRVQLAALKYAAGDLSRLREAATLASVDWRDLLTATGLENDDWAEVLTRAGFPVPK